MAEAKHGLILTLPGAPATPHIVYDAAGILVPGYFHRDVPTPVGGDGDLGLATARELADDPSTHLALVDLKAAECAAAREYWSEVLPTLRGGLTQASARAQGTDLERIQEEASAAAPSVYTAPDAAPSQEG